MTLKEKVVLLSFVNFMLAFPLVLIDVLAMRINIIILIIIKLYYFTFKVRTITLITFAVNARGTIKVASTTFLNMESCRTMFK